MANEIKDAIVENATGPAEVEVDGQRARAHSLKSQIEADKHVRAIDAREANTLGGVRLSKLVPPGAV